VSFFCCFSGSELLKSEKESFPAHGGLNLTAEVADMAREKALAMSRFVPCSVVILTVATKEKQDAMTASTMFVSEDPPILAVSVAKKIVSHDLIEEAGSFSLNLVTEKQVKLAVQVGFTHGREVDKFKKFTIPKEKASKVSAPRIKGSFASLECEVITSLSTANYVVYLAQVVASKINQRRMPIAWYRNKYFALTSEIR
jgi:flavin reductase (DIM6/NTAB) family NADH-FMN oxidoreductase RutF